MPRYETPEDRQKEKSVIDAIATATKRRGFQLPPLYVVDAVFCKPNSPIDLAVEVKCRNVTYGQYDGVFLDAARIITARAWRRTFKNMAWALAVQTSDGALYIWRDNDEALPLFMAGRTVKTRDANDVEPVVNIPWEWFKRLDNAKVND